MFKGFIKYEKLNSKIKLSNNSSFVILIFIILKFRNINHSTFRRSKIWPPPIRWIWRWTESSGIPNILCYASIANLINWIFADLELIEKHVNRVYCFHIELFLWRSMLLDFGIFTVKASWIHRIFKIWCHDKEKLKNSNSSKI